MKKSFKILVSRKLPNDSICSIEFYTDLEDVGIEDHSVILPEKTRDTNLSEGDVYRAENRAEKEADLARRVYNSTINDLLTFAEEDDIVKYVYEGVKKGVSTLKMLDKCKEED